jgi:hypothetical protein
MYSVGRGENPIQVYRVPDFLTRLWREVFGEPPPLADDPQLLGQILVESLPLAPPYQPVDLRAFTRRTGHALPAEEIEEEDRALRA